MKRTEQDWLAWANENLSPRLVAEYRRLVMWAKATAEFHAWKPVERAAVTA